MKHIRPLLTNDSAVVVACGIVGSRLDYCNSLLYGTSVDNLSRLQRVQKHLGKSRDQIGMESSFHADPGKTSLAASRASYSIQKSPLSPSVPLHQNNPPYLHDLISKYIPARTLRSTDKFLLNTKRTNTKIGGRAFSAAAPDTWNALPTDIKLTDSLNKFKIDLKTHLFRMAFK